MASVEVSSDSNNVPKEELKLIWFNLFMFILYYLPPVYGVFTLSVTEICWQTYLWALSVTLLGSIGLSVGSHRLWSHRSFKAVFPLRAFLMLCFTSCGQNSLYDWVRDHRLHHKFSDTNADPQNPTRGLFYAHVGWILHQKHTEQLRLGRELDMSDVLADPVVIFNSKHFTWLKFMLFFVIPIIVPPIYWNETWYNSLMICFSIRVFILSNTVFSINSLAHKWGNKSYRRGGSPTDNMLVSWMTLGDGWHNYHHAFPWDYRSSEFGPYVLNLATHTINFFAALGMAYDLRTPSPDLIRRTIERNGDGSHYKYGDTNQKY